MDDARPVSSAPVRFLLVVAGTVFVVLGLLGLLLPVVPTTPFLLAAAACYARASGRFYRWLLASPLFGTTIRQWRLDRSMPLRAKQAAIAMVVVVFAASTWMLLGRPWICVPLLAFGVGLIVCLARIPSRRQLDPS